MARPPVWMAVDTDDIDAARRLVAAVAPALGGVKLGLQFFAAHGPDGVRALMAGVDLPLFLDLKFHDIPNTVAAAVQSVAPLRPAFLTVHAAGGRAMIAAARATAPAATRILAVTILTSLDAGDLDDIGMAPDPLGQVVRLAGVARDGGADGVVCSPLEVAAVRAAWPDGFLMVPGVRPAGAAVGDQKRVMTPRDALAAGTSGLVIGRPITRAADPAAAARAIAAALS